MGSFSLQSCSFASVNSRLTLPVSTDTKSVRDKPVWLRFLVVSVPCAAAVCMLQLRISSCTPAFGSTSGWCLRRWPAPPGFCLGAPFAGVWALVWCAGAVSGLVLHRQGPAAGWPAEARACTEFAWPELLGSATAAGKFTGECEVARAMAPTARPASGQQPNCGWRWQFAVSRCLRL